MFSIIIPTMWKFEPFLDFLKILTRSPLVGEIIIINNNIKNTPNSSILSNEKIKIHDFQENIFVNPAWNYGVKTSQYDLLCIMNDDLVFDVSIFDVISPILTPDVGLFGLISNVDANHKIINPSSSIKLSKIPFYEVTGVWYVPWHQLSTFNIPFPYGVGQLMFINKCNWVDIPEDLLVYCGDCFIYDTQQLAGRDVYGIENLWHYTPFSVTSNSLTKKFIEYEGPYYEKLIGNIKKDMYLKKIKNHS